MATTERSKGLRPRVQRIIRRFSGRVGVAARNLTTGETLFINERELLPPLSAIKLAIMSELFFRIDQGEMELGDRMTVEASDLRGGTGVLRDLDTPLSLTVKDVCMLMMTVSDNSATWMLAHRLGHENVNRRMRSLGLKEIELRVDLSPEMFKEIEGSDIDAVAVSSAADLTELVCMMARGELVSAEASRQMLGIMARCQHVDYLGRYLPINQFPEESNIEPEARLYNKIGAYLHGRIDVGLVETRRSRYVVTVMTAHSTDPSLILPVHEGVECIARVSRGIYEVWG